MKKTGNRSGAIMRLAAALCLILLLTGCASGTQSSGSAVVTEPPATEPPAEPVKTLSCIEMESMPTMVPTGDGMLAACWTDFEGSTTHVVMIDTENDAVAATISDMGRTEARASFSFSRIMVLPVKLPLLCGKLEYYL